MQSADLDPGLSSMNMKLLLCFQNILSCLTWAVHFTPLAPLKKGSWKRLLEPFPSGAKGGRSDTVADG